MHPHSPRMYAARNAARACLWKKVQRKGKFFIPANPAVYEEKIKRSLFIADLAPVHNEDEGKNFLSRIISKYRDATHNCRAYIFANGSEYSSDDGEPSGTAGKPILNAIKHSGLVNVMIIVTRYFGGVKLGTRGLIDAYGMTAAKALEMAEIKECIITQKFFIVLEYSQMGLITRLLENYPDSYNPEEMLKNSYTAGQAINLAQTTAGHAMCYKITGLYNIAHGHAAALCNRVLFKWLIHKNLPVLKDIAESMNCGTPEEAAEKFNAIFERLNLQIPEANDQEIKILSESVNPERLKNFPAKLDLFTIKNLYMEILNYNGR